MFVLLVMLQWNRLPPQVPSHFGLSGEPDAWSSRSTILILPLIAAVIYVSLTLLTRIPHTYNYPWPITDANAEEQYRLSQRLLRIVKNIVVLLFGIVYVVTVRVAAGEAQGLTVWFLPLLLGSVAATIGWYLYAARRAR